MNRLARHGYMGVSAVLDSIAIKITTFYFVF